MEVACEELAIEGTFEFNMSVVIPEFEMRALTVDPTLSIFEINWWDWRRSLVFPVVEDANDELRVARDISVRHSGADALAVIESDSTTDVDTRIVLSHRIHVANVIAWHRGFEEASDLFVEVVLMR